MKKGNQYSIALSVEPYPMVERWLRYLKKQSAYGLVSRKNHKPEAIWCPECKLVLNNTKQPK